MFAEHATHRCCTHTLTFMTLIMTTIVWIAVPAVGQDRGDHESHHQAADKPINAMCPIGKEPIQKSAPTVQYKGHTLGFCCPGCDKAFLDWSEDKKDEFVRLALAGKEPGHQTHSDQPATTQPDELKSDPYLLETCPVSGQKLGSMGDPVVKEYDGREVRFCCAGCVGKFEADKDKYFAEIDKKMIERQLPYYPLATCVVMGDEELGSMGEPVNRIYKNRLVRFCCKMCVKKFNENPQKFLEKLDKAVIERQREHYPFQTCAVMGDSKLGSMGDPVEKVYGTRLVKFCCSGCIKKFEENPTAFVQRLDKAWKEHGHMPGARNAHHDDDHDHDHKDRDHDHEGHGHDADDHDDHDHNG